MARVEYGKLIGATYRIALHNWRLWPFGLFAGTGGGGLNLSYQTDGRGDGIDSDLLVVLGLVLLALVLAGAVLSVLSQGALAEGVAAIDRGERRGFRQALRAGRATFWRVLGLFLLGTLVALAVVLALLVVCGGAVLVVFTVTDTVGLRVLVAVLAALGAVAALLLLLLPLALILQHALRELVLGGQPAVAALKGGWRLFRANLGPTILVFLIQQGLVLVGYTGIAIVALVLSSPAITFLLLFGASTGVIVVAAITALVVVPAGLAAAGAVGTFGHGLWTLAYLRMRSRETPGRA